MPFHYFTPYPFLLLVTPCHPFLVLVAPCHLLSPLFIPLCPLSPFFILFHPLLSLFAPCHTFTPLDTTCYRWSYHLEELRWTLNLLWPCCFFESAEAENPLFSAFSLFSLCITICHPFSTLSPLFTPRHPSSPLGILLWRVSSDPLSIKAVLIFCNRWSWLLIIACHPVSPHVTPCPHMILLKLWNYHPKDVLISYHCL